MADRALMQYRDTTDRISKSKETVRERERDSQTVLYYARVLKRTGPFDEGKRQRA